LGNSAQTTKTGSDNSDLRRLRLDSATLTVQ